jgi:S-adenosylmethionine uptake transporter
LVMLNPNLRGALLGLAAFGLYALYDMTIKLLGGDYSPVQILFFAMLFAVPALLVQILTDRNGGGLRPALPGWTVARSGAALFNGVLGAYGFAVLPLAECYAIFFTMPLMIALLAVVFLKEPMDLSRMLAIVAGFVGVLVVLRPGQSAILPAHGAVFAAAALGKVTAPVTVAVVFTVKVAPLAMRILLKFPVPVPEFIAAVAPPKVIVAVPAFRKRVFFVARIR